MTTEKVNVALNSNAGHYIEKAKKVVELDKANGVFFVEGEALLTTKNHTSLEISESCLITTQNVYNPFTAMFEKSKD